MEVESVLVTGANRGIGLELVRQLLNLPQPPRYIFATYRSNHTVQDLENIGKNSKHSKVVLIKMDVTQLADIKRAKEVVEEAVGKKGLNLLINNAGVAKHAAFPDLTEENMLLHYKTNTIGPTMMFQEMFPLLQKAAALREGSHMNVSRAAVLNVSSSIGSIVNAHKQPQEWLFVTAYSISKAALNMAMQLTSPVAKEHGILVVNLCPGWVKTDMGTEKAEITPAESVSSILDTLSRLDESHHAAYIDRNGVTIPF